MKIGKLTLDGYFNYGNVLQNYALQKVLTYYGDVDSLWHGPDNFIVRKWHKWGWKEPFKFVLNWKGFRSNIFSDFFGMEMVRQGKIKDWCDRYINTRIVSDNLHKIADEYDYFVVGSDQVWNPYLSDLDSCFLSFAPPYKRISYAASISCPTIEPSITDWYREKLKEMSHISLREQQGADLVKSICGINVPVVVDPTLLLTSDDWRNVSRNPTWYSEEDYVLTYFLGKRPEIVKDLEQLTGMKVINLLDRDSYAHYVIGPDEFLWAIEHAKLLYTDSFHGTVFSILFRTPFVVCDRIGSSITEQMGSRIDTLLAHFDLMNRRASVSNNYRINDSVFSPDWSNVEPVLFSERKRAHEYLRASFNI